MRLQRRKGKKGQSLVEYALLLVLVSVVAIAVLSLVGQAVKRPVAVVAGSLGVKKNAAGSPGAGTTNVIYVDQYDAAHGVGNAVCDSGSGTITVKIVVSTDITSSDMLISIDGTVYQTAGAGTGSVTLAVPLLSGHTCPKSMVLSAKQAVAIIPVVPL